MSVEDHVILSVDEARRLGQVFHEVALLGGT